MRFIIAGPREGGLPPGPKTYVIRPTRRYSQDGMVEIRYGLKAVFLGGNFDSELAALEHGWSEEERKFVEGKLLAHGDFGNGLYLHPNEKLGRDERASAADRVTPTPSADSVPRQAQCIAEGTGDNPLCLRPCAPGHEFCPQHEAEFAPAVAEVAAVEGGEFTDVTAPPMPVEEAPVEAGVGAGAE